MNWFADKSVVVPYDFSELSFKALEQARDLVELPSQLKVIHVSMAMNPMEPGVLWDSANKEAIRKRSRESFFERIDPQRFQGVDFAIRFGDPGKEIVEFAKEIGADLIVMPSHGYGWFKRITLGSVAERVVRLAHCPVLVLRGLLTAEQAEVQASAALVT